MELRDAREVIAHYRKIDEKVYLGPAIEAAIVLDTRITELEAQRDELVRAALGVLKIAQSTYHSDDRGPGDLCSILENAIEKATGGKWWNVIKASDKEVKDGGI